MTVHERNRLEEHTVGLEKGQKKASDVEALRRIGPVVLLISAVSADEPSPSRVAQPREQSPMSRPKRPAIRRFRGVPNSSNMDSVPVTVTRVIQHQRCLGGTTD